MSGNPPLVFVTGNSRSGTTMLGRILSNHPAVFTFHELQLLDSAISADQFNDDEPISLTVRTEFIHTLIARQKSGLYSTFDETVHKEEASKLIDYTDGMSFSEVYESFLRYEAKGHGANIPCEQSPYYLSYVDDLNDQLNNCYFINFIRDPRDVAQSQKRRWKRNSLGNGSHPFFGEVLRSWANYHPYTTSKIWTNNSKTASKHLKKPNFIQVRYEDLLLTPELSIKKICDLIGVEFDINMIDIPIVGSSTNLDSNDGRGFDTSRIGSWKEKQILSESEIAIIEHVSREEIESLGYEMGHSSINLVKIVWYSLTFFIKMSLSVVLNIYRYKNIIPLIKRRLNL